MDKDSMSTHLVAPPSQDMVSSLVLKGDLSGMKPAEKVEYYNWLCKSLGLNPSTKPFEILNLKGKEVMYAKKDATEQLRKIYGVSVVELTQTIDNGLCISKCRVQDAQGRFDVATGVTVITTKMTPEDTANAIMKSETKAKRRATLSICGLGMLDETELDTVGSYETVPLQEISKPKKLLKDLIVAKRELEDALSTEELKATWLKYPEWHKELSFQELKELRKTQLQAIESVEDPDTTALLTADSTEVLTSVFTELTSRPEWQKGYGQDYKDLMQKIYSIKLRRLNVELDAG